MDAERKEADDEGKRRRKREDMQDMMVFRRFEFMHGIWWVLL
jgi:hypothetical protein